MLFVPRLTAGTDGPAPVRKLDLKKHEKSKNKENKKRKTMKTRKKEDKRNQWKCVWNTCVSVLDLQWCCIALYWTAEMARKLDFPRFVQIKVGRIDKWIKDNFPNPIKQSPALTFPKLIKMMMRVVLKVIEYDHCFNFFAKMFSTFPSSWINFFAPYFFRW